MLDYPSGPVLDLADHPTIDATTTAPHGVPVVGVGHGGDHGTRRPAALVLLACRREDIPAVFPMVAQIAQRAMVRGGIPFPRLPVAECLPVGRARPVMDVNPLSDSRYRVRVMRSTMFRFPLGRDARPFLSDEQAFGYFVGVGP